MYRCTDSMQGVTGPEHYVLVGAVQSHVGPDSQQAAVSSSTHIHLEPAGKTTNPQPAQASLLPNVGATNSTHSHHSHYLVPGCIRLLWRCMDLFPTQIKLLPEFPECETEN